MTRLEDSLRHVARETDALIARLLPPEQGPEARLLGAMRYAALGPGKRLRPLLVRAAADLFEVPAAQSLRVGAAIELLHAYSLVHDDLPCMDDDDMRRGRPTVHRAYDEASAVLAGDGLQAMAFEILADPATHPSAEVRIDLVRALAHAAGPGGMVGGQAIDLAAATLDLDAAGVTRLQNLKTGAVFAFCCEAGGILGHASPQQRLALRAYAHDFGLAFQIADDLLDIEGDATVVGKAVGKDDAAGKATLVGLLGVEGARRQAGLLAAQAAQHVESFGPKAALLRDLAAFAIARHA